MNKKLKTLEEHNKQISDYYFDNNSPELNGISCPKCVEELFDSKPMITLTSYPAQKNVHCSKCDYIGYRLA